MFDDIFGYFLFFVRLTITLDWINYYQYETINSSSSILILNIDRGFNMIFKKYINIKKISKKPINKLNL